MNSNLKCNRLRALPLLILCVLATTRGLNAENNGDPPSGAGGTPPPASAGATSQTGTSQNIAAVLSDHFYIEAGEVTLQPYSISSSTKAPGKYNFSAGGPDGREMIQGIIQYRDAWLTNAPKGLLHPDFDFRLGYALGASGSQSTTTTGSGDEFGEGSIGLAFQLNQPGEETQLTLNLEGFGRFYSDSQYSLIHAAYGTGVAFVGGIRIYSPETAPRLKFLVRLGYAQLDAPIFIGPDLVDATGDGEPKFEMHGAADFSAEVHIPVVVSDKSWGAFSVGGAFDKFSNDTPDQWSVYAGYTISISDLVNRFTGK